MFLCLDKKKITFRRKIYKEKNSTLIMSNNVQLYYHNRSKIYNILKQFFYYKIFLSISNVNTHKSGRTVLPCSQQPIGK